MIENEIKILRRVKHEHIVQLIEEYETPKEIFLVMELLKVSKFVIRCLVVYLILNQLKVDLRLLLAILNVN